MSDPTIPETCKECGEEVNEEGLTLGDCPGGSGIACDECCFCSCDGSC